MKSEVFALLNKTTHRFQYFLLLFTVAPLFTVRIEHFCKQCSTWDKCSTGHLLFSWS